MRSADCPMSQIKSTRRVATLKGNIKSTRRLATLKGEGTCLTVTYKYRFVKLFISASSGLRARSNRPCGRSVQASPRRRMTERTPIHRLVHCSLSNPYRAIYEVVNRPAYGPPSQRARDGGGLNVHRYTDWYTAALAIPNAPATR